jgi:hypothetical protein
MRAFNDGRFLETEVELSEHGKSMTWGFTLGDIRTKSVLRMDEKDEWMELHEISVGSQPPKNLMERAIAERSRCGLILRITRSGESSNEGPLVWA